MPHYAENRMDTCQYCGSHVPGHESQSQDAYGRVIVECTWVCPACNQLSRREDLTHMYPDIMARNADIDQKLRK